MEIVVACRIYFAINCPMLGLKTQVGNRIIVEIE